MNPFFTGIPWIPALLEDWYCVMEVRISATFYYETMASTFNHMCTCIRKHTPTAEDTPCQACQG
jgi:hypothetical protein